MTLVSNTPSGWTLNDMAALLEAFDNAAAQAAVVTAGVGKRVVPIGLPDQFLDAGALPTLHDRYGLTVDRIVAKVLAELG